MGVIYRYAGPDGDAISALPAGECAAIGSEYCTHLLPDAAALERAISASRARGTSLLLLSPYFRDRELKGFVGLLRGIPPDAAVDVAVNDWGALLAARTLFPRLDLSLGRLLSGQKSCPRIGGSTRISREARDRYGEGLFSSPAARGYLRREFGLRRFHVDRLERGPEFPVPQPLAAENAAPFLVVHGPCAIVTVSDSCPWIGGKSSSAVPSCPRPCRRGSVALLEPSMGRGMLQRGKARFVRSLAPGQAEAPEGTALVFYDDLP